MQFIPYCGNKPIFLIHFFSSHNYHSVCLQNLSIQHKKIPFSMFHVVLQALDLDRSVLQKMKKSVKAINNSGLSEYYEQSLFKAILQG